MADFEIPVPMDQLPEKASPEANDKFVIDTPEGPHYSKWGNVLSQVRSGINLGFLTPSSPAAPSTGLHIGQASAAGTYVNFGNIVVTQAELDSNFVYFTVTNGVVAKVLSKKPKGADGKTIETWSAKVYASGSSVYYNGKIYEASAATVAGDVPGTAAVWVERLSGAPSIVEKAGFNEFDESKATIYNTQYKASGFVKAAANTQYTLSTAGGNMNYITDIKAYDSNKTELTVPTTTTSNNAPVRSGKVFTTPANTAYVTFNWRFLDGSGNPLANTIMLAKTPNALADYQPYSPSFEFTQSNYVSFDSLRKKQVAYVAFDGSDSNNGQTETTPYLTLQKAITNGASIIYMKRGVYELQNINAANLDSLTILPNNNSETYAHANPNRQLIVFKNSKTITGLSSDSGLLKTAFAGMPLWNEVFITKTQTPTNGVAPTGGFPIPRVVLWKTFTDIKDDFRLTPVTTLSACQSTADSFYWDGTYVYINSANNAVSFEATDNTKSFTINNIKELKMEDVVSDFYNYQSFDIDAVAKGRLTNCKARHVNYYNGFSVDNSNVDLFGCVANKVNVDGFNFHGYGMTNLYDCVARHNYDDGCSHHDGCVGTIRGGDYSFNGKTGIAPAYGANVDCYHVKATNNPTGIGYLTTTNGHAPMKGKVSGCVLVNNTRGLTANSLATVEEWGNTFVGNGINKEGTMTSY